MSECFSKPFLKWALVMAVLAMIGASAAVAQGQPVGQHAAQDAADDPIAFTGHGGMFTASGQQVLPTTAFIRTAEAWYRSRLIKQLSKKQRAQFDTVEKSLTSELKLDEQSRLVADAYLLDWLAKTVATRQSVRMFAKVEVIKLNLQTTLPAKGGSNISKSPELFKINPDLAKRLAVLLNTWPKFPSVLFLSTSTSGTAYRAECAANGVPVPPDIGTPDTTGTNGWIPRGLIPQSELFITQADQAEVMTYHSTSPEGMCVSLPRFNSAGTVDLDGVICVGKVSSKVCFWDNEKNGVTNTFPRFSSGTTRTVVPLTDFGAGTEISVTNGGNGGVCSNCHAGENPYVIHGTTLSNLAGVPLPTFPDNWADPMVPVDTPPWPQNPGPMNSPPSCNGCHGAWNARGYAGRFPHLSSDLRLYCGAVLRSSIGALAPPLLPPSGRLNPPATMPLGASAGSLACTPGLPSTDPRNRPCSASTTQNCTPSFDPMDPRRSEPDFPAAYQVACTPEMGALLALCGTSPVADASNRGDPHITTYNGISYDFQSAGEFTSLRGDGGTEIQTRQTPASTAGAPLLNAYTGLSSCVSLNTAVAARMGKTRISYQPRLGGEPGAMELRVDGRLTTLGATGLTLPDGGRIARTAIGSGIEIFFRDQTHLIVSSNWWGAPQNLWYLNVDVVSTPAREGLMGAVLPGSWLPLLPDGTTLGPIPASLHQRYLDLNGKFANAWRVTGATSLFDYAPGTSTATFTDSGWPAEDAKTCKAPGSTVTPAEPMDPHKARELCGQIVNKVTREQCVFDVTATGDPGFARGYVISQQLLMRATGHP